MHDDAAPCFVFDEVPGTIEGSRVLVNFFGGKRKNMTLGFPTDLSKIELSEGFRSNFMGPMTRIPPRYVNDGPIFENVLRGDDIDVTSSRRRNGTRTTAAATSAPAASTSRAIRTRAGSTSAPIA